MAADPEPLAWRDVWIARLERRDGPSARRSSAPPHPSPPGPIPDRSHVRGDRGATRCRLPHLGSVRFCPGRAAHHPAGSDHLPAPALDGCGAGGHSHLQSSARAARAVRLLWAMGAVVRGLEGSRRLLIKRGTEFVLAGGSTVVVVGGRPIAAVEREAPNAPTALMVTGCGGRSRPLPPSATATSFPTPPPDAASRWP